MHVRRAIRERVASNITGLATTGSNVFQSRIHTLGGNNLPCILVYTQSETSEPNQMGTDRVLDRTLSINLEIYVKATDDVDDVIDGICVNVEEAIAGDISVNNLARDITLSSTSINFIGEGDQPLGVASLTYDVLYQVRESDLETAL